MEERAAPLPQRAPAPPGGPDVSVLDEPFLAYCYGTEAGADGNLGPGTWLVVDGTGEHRANIVVQGAELVARHYTMVDLDGQVLMALRKSERQRTGPEWPGGEAARSETQPTGATDDVAVFDAAGLEVGRYERIPGGGIRFTTPDGSWGGPSRGSGSGTPVVDSAGKAVARVYGHSPNAPLNVLGSWPAIHAEWAWYLIDMRFRLADPMRSLVLGMPCLSHWRLSGTL